MDDIKKNFIHKYNNGSAQILRKNLIADIETPISSLLKLSNNQNYSFLLESVQGGSNRGRYSLLGCEPDLIWEVKNRKSKIKYLDNNYNYNITDEPIKSLKELIEISKLPDQNLTIPFPTLVGYLGYSMIQYMEEINLNNPDTLNIPEAILIRPKIVAVFDNIKDTISLMTISYPSKEVNAEKAYNDTKKLLDLAVEKIQNNKFDFSFKDFPFKEKMDFISNYSKKEYLKIVEKAKNYIEKGDIFQVVTSQRFESEYELKAIDLYRSLRRLNPSPYLVNLNFNDFGLVASSPELMVQLRNQKVTIRPIAGTRKRGGNHFEDMQLSKELLNDKKELAEHLMLLDLGRNDVGRVCVPNSVKVTEEMIIEYYSHVMHIVSNVEGVIDKKFNAVDALIAGFPAGTVSGAPKIRAMEIIEELENINRSFYAGCMGYFDSNGNMDTCISLRTGLVKDNKLFIQAGGGVVYDSKPENEFQETINKANALIAAAEDSYKYK